MQGWVKLHRKLINHWLWEDKPFARGQAYIDIVLKANHSENTKCFNGNLITINRGEIITSIRELCTDWGWSNSKVKKFLTMLEADKMIEVKSDTKKTVIKVLNYGKYQGVDNAKNDTETSQKHIKSISETYQKHTNKNDKNNKECKECKEDEEVGLSYGNREKLKLLYPELDWEAFEKDDFNLKPASFYCNTNKKVFLSNVQVEYLMEYLGIEAMQYYIQKLADFMVDKKTSVKNHFATILKWSREDGNL